jgi:hypothetical protein
MPQLSKAEKTAVKKVKAQASAKVEVKGMGGFPNYRVIPRSPSYLGKGDFL